MRFFKRNLARQNGGYVTAVNSSFFKYLTATIMIGLCGLPLAALADIDIRSGTIVRGFERRVESGEDKLVLPVYEYLGVDYGDMEQGGLSFHLYGWGRKDMAGGNFYDDDPEGELLYGYLRYQKPYSRFGASVGRQHVFAGVANQSVDGLHLSGGIGPNLSASIFGGVPVDYQGQDGGSADATYGTRIAHHLEGRYELGLSYQKTEADGEFSEEKAGADLMFNPGSRLTLTGLSSYNMDSKDWREHRYDARIQVRDLMVEPSFQYFSYQDYFGKGNSRNNIFHFLQNEEENLVIAGTDIVWQGLGSVDVGVRGRHYDYDRRRESASYMAGLLTVNTSSGSQIGVEIGRMDGETADNIYNMYRGYFYWRQPLKIMTQGFISGDALYIAYDAPIYGEDKSIQYSMSAGRYFFNNRMETKLSGIFSQDPYFESDVGGVVTLNVYY
jgi:hypothetical protein